MAKRIARKAIRRAGRKAIRRTRRPRKSIRDKETDEISNIAAIGFLAPSALIAGSIAKGIHDQTRDRRKFLEILEESRRQRVGVQMQKGGSPKKRRRR